MADYGKLETKDGLSDSYDDMTSEDGTLLPQSMPHCHHKPPQILYRNGSFLFLLVTNIILTGCTVGLLTYIYAQQNHDPSLGVYSPANGAVEYVEKHLQAAFFTPTDYMGSTDEIDKKWEDLYNFGNSIISREEADKLHTPTLPIPGTNDYLVQLDVWHELHCLNDIRKVFYPERFGDQLANLTRNGVVQRENNMFRHWEHCIDSLRQVLMCHADVSPISFHVNLPENKGIFSRLATTHTCRNFEKLQDWAKSHSAGDYKYLLTPEQAQEVIDTAGFDQSPEEDIERFWPSFPGNLFFKHWRDAAEKSA